MDTEKLEIQISEVDGKLQALLSHKGEHTMIVSPPVESGDLGQQHVVNIFMTCMTQVIQSRIFPKYSMTYRESKESDGTRVHALGYPWEHSSSKELDSATPLQ